MVGDKTDEKSDDSRICRVPMSFPTLYYSHHAHQDFTTLPFIYIQSVSGNLSFNIQNNSVITFFYEAFGLMRKRKVHMNFIHKSERCCDSRKNCHMLGKFIEESEKITTYKGSGMRDMRWWVMCQDVDVDIHLWAETESNLWLSRLSFGSNSQLALATPSKLIFYF